MKPKRKNPDFLNGVPELLVLRLLARRAMHGYELVQSLERVAGETLAVREVCINPILHRLECDKLLASRKVSVGGRNRFVYHVTAAGRKRLADRVSTWRRITQAIALALEGEGDGVVKLA